jgi:DNA gyrase subunit B
MSLIKALYFGQTRRYMTQEYTSQNITVLEGLDAVRMRPGMYIGSTGSKGMHHLLWEIVDNAVDEASNKFASEIAVTLHNDGSCSVWDNGRGVPVDNHKSMNMPGVQVIFTQLHAGGKFGQKNYTYSGGLHGVGASVVNALSKWLVVDSFKDWEHYRMRFELAKDKDNKEHAGRVVNGLEKIGGTRKRGTLVRFLPDDSIFEDVRFDEDRIIRRLRELAYLNKGVQISFSDERDDSEKQQVTFKFDGGISDYVKYLNSDRDIINEEPIMLHGIKDDVVCEAALQYTEDYSENIFSYVNCIPTSEGGTHETGFKAALTKVMNDYARKNGFLKDKDNNLSGEDFREGLTAVLNLKVKNPQFEGQVKGKLGNTEVRSITEAIITQELSLFLEQLSNADTANNIVEKAVKAAKVREASRKAREVARTKNALEAAPLVGKLSSCTGRKPEQNELFIVEGDSAGGSAKQGRDRKFQAILPLRGKPLNVEKKRLDQVLNNEEFRSIITALGTNIDESFSIDNLKYHKVIILSDADQDGAHIRAILLTFFFRYMKDLILNGKVYIGMPPLYLVKYGSKSQYAYDDKELKKITSNLKNYTIQRYKGLGEMNPEQLWDTTMNPETRKLLRVDIEDAARADRLISVLMGDKVEPRRNYISKHANFYRPDDFVKLK